MPEQPWVPKLSKKQLDVFNCYDRFILCSGGRLNGKTIGIAHKVFRHLWETPGARVAVVAKTIGSAKEGGAWSDLIEIIAPEWMNSNMYGEGGPIAYTTQNGAGLPGPKMDAATRTSSFKIRNMFGGESECLLFSLSNESNADIEAKLKSKRYSLIWISELSNFENRSVFNKAILQLRMPHLRYDQQHFIADTNPAPEGEDSWIYQLWYVERNKKDHPKPKFRDNLRLFEFHLSDNPFLDQAQIDDLEGSCSNPGDYDRDVLGKWTKGFGFRGKIFADLIDPSIHFVDGTIDLNPVTIDMRSGWDIGQVNNACVFVEMINHKNRNVYCIVEEIVTLNDEISTADYALKVYDRMLALEAHYQKNFEWHHWSDDSAFNMWRASVGAYDAAIVSNATEGAISLQEVNKPQESVKTGIALIRRALKEHRIFVGSNCPHAQEMLAELTESDLDNHSTRVHIFDAFRYVIYMEERTEALMQFMKPKTRPDVQPIHVL